MQNVNKDNKLYKSLFDLCIDPIEIITKEGIIIDVNTAWLNLFECTRKEAIGNSAQFMWCNSEDKIKWKHLVELDGFVRNMEIKCKSNNNIEIICLISSTVCSDDLGNALGYQSIIRDITEQRRIEFKVKRKTEFINSVLAAIPDDIVVVNAERAVVWSNLEEEIPLGSLICNSMHGHKVSHPTNCVNDSGDPDCPISEVFNTGKSISFESRSDGKVWWHVVTPCNYNGHVSTVMELRRNITEEKQNAERIDIEGLKSIAKEVAESYRGMYAAIAELVQPKGEGDCRGTEH